MNLPDGCTPAMVDRAMGGCSVCLEDLAECVCEMEAATKADMWYDQMREEEIA